MAVLKNLLDTARVSCTHFWPLELFMVSHILRNKMAGCIELDQTYFDFLTSTVIV